MSGKTAPPHYCRCVKARRNGKAKGTANRQACLRGLKTHLTSRQPAAPGGAMELLSRLAVQRTLTEYLLERIVDYKNLKPMVRPNGFTINSYKNDTVKMLAETAVIRSTYVRWCGGTAAKAPPTRFPFFQRIQTLDRSEAPKIDV